MAPWSHPLLLFFQIFLCATSAYKKDPHISLAIFLLASCFHFVIICGDVCDNVQKATCYFFKGPHRLIDGFILIILSCWCTLKLFPDFTIVKDSGTNMVLFLLKLWPVMLHRVNLRTPGSEVSTQYMWIYTSYKNSKKMSFQTQPTLSL